MTTPEVRPLGKALGEEITIRNSTVSALRRRGGILDKIQVNGGMDPGNSGGPVVDSNGDVVGVAVSGYEGRLINFAIPGERVTNILKGRLSSMVVGQAFTDRGKVNLPVGRMTVIKDIAGVGKPVAGAHLPGVRQGATGRLEDNRVRLVSIVGNRRHPGIDELL